MEGPISFWGYKEQKSNLILPKHDDDNHTDTHTHTQFNATSVWNEFVKIYGISKISKRVYAQKQTFLIMYFIAS